MRKIPKIIFYLTSGERGEGFNKIHFYPRRTSVRKTPQCVFFDRVKDVRLQITLGQKDKMVETLFHLRFRVNMYMYLEPFDFFES